MFVLEIAFDDHPRRLEGRPAHRARLTDLRATGTLVMAGPWSDGTGALLVFDTDEAGLERILREDPYYSLPGVRVVSRRAWAPLDLGEEDARS